MATLNLQVSASTDDTRNVNGNGTYNATAVTFHIGINSTVDYWNGWRFLNATIPAGATINSATLDLYSAGLTGSSAEAIFYGINQDDTATFANATANKPEGRPRTTASINKTFTTGGTGFGIATIDVTTLVQEIVNRGGWSSGNALGIVAHDNGSANNNYQAQSTWDFTGNARGAKLDIDYTVPVFSALTDDFDDNSLDAVIWSNWGGGNVSETSQQLQISSGTAASSYYGLDTVASYDLTDNAVFIQVVDAGAQGAPYGLYPLQLERDANNQVYWYINDGAAYAYKVAGGVYTSLDTISHTNGNYYRIRSISTTIYFDYSADGASWTNLTSTTSPGAITALRLIIFTEITSLSTARTAKLDNLNFVPVVDIDLTVSGLKSAPSLSSADLTLVEVETFYFDGHSGISDPDGAWETPEDVFDDDPSTTGGAANGSSTSNYLEGKGTTAPSSGGDITEVRARVRTADPTGIVWKTLDEPSGGWSWSAVQNLETRIWAEPVGEFFTHAHAAFYEQGDSGGVSLGEAIRESLTVGMIDVEVTYADSGDIELPINSLASAPALSTATLTQQQTLTGVGSIKSASTISSATLTQHQSLSSVTSLKSQPSLSSPSLTQAQSLSSVGSLTSAPVISSATLTQQQQLASLANLVSAAILSSVTLTQQSTLTDISDLVSQPVLGSVSLAQAQSLSPGSLITSPQISMVSLGSVMTLDLASLLSSPVLESVSLAQHSTLTVGSLITAPALSGVSLLQTYLLAVAGLEAQALLSSPTLTQQSVLAVVNLIAASSLSSATLTQAHSLAVTGLISLGFLSMVDLIVDSSRPTFPMSPGTFVGGDRTGLGLIGRVQESQLVTQKGTAATNRGRYTVIGSRNN